MTSGRLIKTHTYTIITLRFNSNLHKTRIEGLENRTSNIHRQASTTPLDVQLPRAVKMCYQQFSIMLLLATSAALLQGVHGKKELKLKDCSTDDTVVHVKSVKDTVHETGPVNFESVIKVCENKSGERIFLSTQTILSPYFIPALKLKWKKVELRHYSPF